MINSPYVSQDLKTVALTLLQDVWKKFKRVSENGVHLEPGAVLRCIGQYDGEDGEETPPVTFFSTPYLALQKKAAFSGRDKGRHMMTLLESLYGYDVEGDREDSQIVRKLFPGLQKDSIHVPQLWCLLVGPDLVITFSELSAKELCGDLIEVDMTSLGPRGPRTIQVFDLSRRRYNLVVDIDCNYVVRISELGVLPQPWLLN